jgi:phosphoribosylformylglycinamidine synthase
MAQLVEAVEGMADACRFFDTPITGGNVSLYNETLGEGIYPTPVLGIVGLMKTAVPAPVKFSAPGAKVLLLGGFGRTDATQFGSSEYAKVILGHLWGTPPKLDMDYEKRVHEAMREIAAEGLAESAHDLSDGGLAVALAEACSEGMGAAVEVPASDIFALFGEAPSRILVSSRHAGRVRKIAANHGVECDEIGVTIELRLQLEHKGTVLFDLATKDLVQTAANALPKLLASTIHD